MTNGNNKQTKFEEQPVEIDIDLSSLMSEKYLKQLEQAQTKQRHPNWKPTKPGSVLIGTIIEVIGFPNLNDGKGGIIMNIQLDEKTETETPIVSMWINTVLQSQLYKLVNSESSNPRDDDFNTRVNTLRLAENKYVGIKYLGDVKSSKRGFKNYQNYVVIELEE